MAQECSFGSSLVAQWVKDLALSLQQLRLLLWCMFSPWPEKFHMLQTWPKKKKKECSFGFLGISVVLEKTLLSKIEFGEKTVWH